VRGYLIDRLAVGGPELRALAGLLDQKDDSVRRAVVLALGEIGPTQLRRAERDALIARLEDLYRNAPGPGLHGAAGWLLRRWHQDKKVQEMDDSLATGKIEGERRW
jgi:hypothetical protein